MWLLLHRGCAVLVNVEWQACSSLSIYSFNVYSRIFAGFGFFLLSGLTPCTLLIRLHCCCYSLYVSMWVAELTTSVLPNTLRPLFVETVTDTVSTLSSRQKRPNGRMTTCVALAARCTPKPCLQPLSAWRFPRRLSKSTFSRLRPPFPHFLYPRFSASLCFMHVACLNFNNVSKEFPQGHLWNACKDGCDWACVFLTVKNGADFEFVYHLHVSKIFRTWTTWEKRR